MKLTLKSWVTPFFFALFLGFAQEAQGQQKIKDTLAKKTLADIQKFTGNFVDLQYKSDKYLDYWAHKFTEILEKDPACKPGTLVAELKQVFELIAKKETRKEGLARLNLPKYADLLNDIIVASYGGMMSCAWHGISRRKIDHAFFIRNK